MNAFICATWLFCYCLTCFCWYVWLFSFFVFGFGFQQRIMTRLFSTFYATPTKNKYSRACNMDTLKRNDPVIFLRRLKKTWRCDIWSLPGGPIKPKNRNDCSIIWNHRDTINNIDWNGYFYYLTSGRIGQGSPRLRGKQTRQPLHRLKSKCNIYQARQRSITGESVSKCFSDQFMWCPPHLLLPEDVKICHSPKLRISLEEDYLRF